LNDEVSRSAVGAALAREGGAAGAPALVDNVETLANVPLIVQRGAAWYREVGTETSPGTIVCTVSGATRRSGVGEVAMGTTLREVIDLVGWGPRRGHQVEVVLSGVANPLIPAELLDTPLTYEAMRDAGSGLGSAGFLVFDETTEPSAVAAGVLRFLAVESCGQCEPCKTDGLFLAERLRRSLLAAPTAAEDAQLRRRIGTVTTGARCNLAQQQALVAASVLDLFPAPRRAAGGEIAGRPEPVLIAPMTDLVGGRAFVDLAQRTKQPDWSHRATDSGAAPAARLANTPVHLRRGSDARRWPEWSATAPNDQPLQIVDEAHERIDRSIEAALDAGEDLLDARVGEVILAVRRHIDVTQRVLYPMVRRVGGEVGDQRVDEAVAQERVLSRLVARLEHQPDPAVLQDLAVELQAHAELDDAVLDLVRQRLAPRARAGLAAGLATAAATSTVGRARRARQATASGPGDIRSLRLAPRAPALAPDASPEREREREPVGGPAAAAAPEAPPDPAPRRGTGRTALGRVLVGVDGSTAATAALGWAGRLALLVGAEVLVGNAFSTDQAELPPEEHAAQREAAERRLRTEWSAPLRAAGVPHRALQLTGPPDVLLRAAEAEGAGLLVLGIRDPGRHAALHLGSVAHRLAHRTRTPLAIVPLPGATEPIHRIVLGLDASASSAGAAAWVAEVAAAAAAEVSVVCCFDADARRGEGTRARAWRAVAEEAISHEWIAPLLDAGLEVRTRIVEAGDPVPAVDAAAREEGASWIVVGAEARSAATGLRSGRVPLQLVHRTHLPVVLVPAREHTGEVGRDHEAGLPPAVGEHGT
jgi:nucleotide-binding universal stress UspA family protein